jgi:hypothetical protein
MIKEERNVHFTDAAGNARQLRKDGYVSAKGMHATNECRRLRLPESKVLRKECKTDRLEVIKCNVAGTLSYWYKLSDLQKLYGPNSTE